MNTRGGEGKLDRFNFRVNLRKIEISLSLSEVRGGRRTRRLNKEITNAFDWAESKKKKEIFLNRPVFARGDAHDRCNAT